MTVIHLEQRAGGGRASERRARRDLRVQIARLEARLGELEADGIRRVPAGSGSGAARIATFAELERTRDRLASTLADARREAERRAEVREATRATLERAIAEPSKHRWLRVRSEALGEPGCRHWHVVPRLGLIGMLAGWWRVKISSGCPLGPISLGNAPSGCVLGRRADASPSRIPRGTTTRNPRRERPAWSQTAPAARPLPR